MKVTIEYQPTEWAMYAGEFECQHPSTSTDAIEHYDHYQEAVTGMPQPLSYEAIENCNDCTAYYSTWDGEWYDGGEL